MEEVDSIILHFLRQLNIDIHNDFKNISELPVEIIVESAIKCIKAINPTVKVPCKLPSGVSQRIEVAAQVAGICKDLGYQNDVGYQTFLYHNETELRQVFMFLIEKLPSEDKKLTTKVKPMNAKYQLLQNISNKIGEDLNTIWIPPCCKPSLKSNVGDFIYSQVSDQTENKEISPDKIIEKISKINKMRNTIPKSEVSHNVLPSKTVVINNKVTMSESDKTLKELQEIVILLRQKLDTLESERNVMNVEFSQAQKNSERAENDLRNMQSILNSVGITEFESDEIENILQKVHNNINMLHNKSEEITSKNLSLKIEIEKMKTKISSSESEQIKCRNTLTNLKETAKSLKDECEKKEGLKNQLKLKYEKLKGGNKRHIYTKRILEIIGNVEKQNAEIKKILEDTRQLQKEINTLEGQLDRCFSIADETLFKDAKRDDQAKKAYKLLALLHSECNTIVSLVNETGTLSRDIIDLEDNIKAEKSKRTEDILKKIQIDLAKLQKETS
ncbi:coiled-coil domain-containing protein 22 homolog [Melitaea cinxia]|uniref:coiled-coil domain-containing protein 22 homolog n=1 Tax=Melitaea cinxia TaxID=113334 RepID=UPI001E272891|nr:coiled-coil domain-containing protein 22 homolog [Melitaea cinxia]